MRPLYYATLTTIFATMLHAATAQTKRQAIYLAQDAQLNQERVELVARDNFRSKKGVTLRQGLATLPHQEGPPDLTFTVNEPTAGRFYLRTHAAVNETGAAEMAKARNKYNSIFAELQIGSDTVVKRILFVPWRPPHSCWQNLGIFELPQGKQEIKIWLPANLQLDLLQINPYTPPKLPAPAQNYTPSTLPPPSHPRVWLTDSSLKQVKANLQHPDHLPLWESLQQRARQPIKTTIPEHGYMDYNTELEKQITAKAFVSLMTDDKELGTETVKLTRDYIARVSFGNILDITREIGNLIYTAALVYDWCHEVTTPSDREIIRHNMIRLAEEMECGWPPFRITIVNGHGNEAMLNRDLLAMSIAIFDDDPLPYHYCAYRIMEELIPMRKFEYQSPRHNQGVGYASYRFNWEMHAAWLLRRMCDRELFDPNIKTLPLYWQHMRLPNGEMLRDGDGIQANRPYRYPNTALVCYTYGNNSTLKAEFQRYNFKKYVDPMLYLLLNDPSLPADSSPEQHPLTIDFGPIMGGMIARTDWKTGTNALHTVVTEVKGGGYHFGNHKHSDAGAIQLYYRGLQVADLGQYHFYGTPYDYSFAKRSVAHSMLLVYDPDETFLKGFSNDGGSRLVTTSAPTPHATTTNPIHNYGSRLSGGFGPDPINPDYSFFATDLKAAYSDKITAYTRSFCFLRLNSTTHPACIIVLDDLATSNPTFQKYWQLNTLKPPKTTQNGIELYNTENNLTGRVDVAMLLPRPDQRTTQILSGDAVYDVFGTRVTPPNPQGPEGMGHRIMFSPQAATTNTTFLTLLQPYSDGAQPQPYHFEEHDTYITLRIADRIALISRQGKLLKEPLNLNLPPAPHPWQIVIAELFASTPYNGYLAKPYTFNDLKQVIQQYIPTRE